MAAAPNAPQPLLSKMVVLAVLGVVLLLPLGLLLGLVKERRATRDAAVAELAGSWGARQDLVGPLLVVPFVGVDGLPQSAIFLPERLVIDGELTTQQRSRGIHSTAVYETHVRVSGRFARPDLAALGIDPALARWDKAFVAMSVSDLRGATSALSLTWGEGTLPLASGTGLAAAARGVHALPGAVLAPVDFAVTLDLRGSGGLRVAPLGTTTEVALRSPWPSPSFQGAFLPVERSLGPSGFSARWSMGQYGRDLPPSWIEMGQPGGRLDDQLLRDALFGVDLIVVVDAYRQVERSVKYGALFVFLVLAGFFLFELRTRRRIHPLQYALVGVAVALFFLVLLALSEVVAFPIAYAAAALVCAAMNAAYARAVLGTGGRAAVVLGGLASGFGLLYVPLALEAYALLAGTAAVVAIVALLMWFTRRVHLEREAPETA